MKYYLIAPLTHSPLLAYSSQTPLQKGELVEIEIKKSIKKGVVWEEIPSPDFQCKPLKSLHLFFLPHQIDLAYFIAQYYCTSLGKAFLLFTPYSKLPQDLPKVKFSSPLELSAHQQKALNFILPRSFSLLFGQTGSGKSEVYIHLIIQTLQKGGNALLLMPEISLTPQMQQRLERVFGKCVGMWHSKMSPKKKVEILQKIQQGEIRLILGARSALFLPINHLKTILIDEEHDDAYKAQNAPRYNARDLAIYLGKKRGIQVLLGSATPSLTSYFLASSQNAIFKLQKFYPSDNEMIFLKQKAELTPPILEAINSTLQAKKQIIIFLPIRANFKYLICPSCGENIKCPFCSISMSLHLDKKIMLCHYCGFSQKIPKNCPNCDGEHFSSQRIGTAQIAKELQEHFPSPYQIAIFDRDHITTQNKLEKTLRDFESHKIDILVGTQMLSKGHDYHNIGLAVIMGLDEILHFGDFKSRERALSLFFQIKGRVGRKEKGKVILQTFNPQFFDRREYEDFLKEELSFRQDLYPPFSKMATLTFTHPNAQKAQSFMQDALKQIQDSPHIQIVGSGKAFIEKINSKYRYIILLRSSSSNITYLLRAIQSLSIPCEIDIDPINIV